MARYSPAVEDYFQDVIKKSWTWGKLTEEEQKRFIDMRVFDRIKGNDATRVEWFNTIYHSYLYALGYKAVGWREEENRKKFKIVLTAMDSNANVEPYTEEFDVRFESRKEAEIWMLHTMNDELSNLNEPDVDNTPHTRVFIADLNGEHDAIIRLWDGEDYFDVTYYDIVEVAEK